MSFVKIILQVSKNLEVKTQRSSQLWKKDFHFYYYRTKHTAMHTFKTARSYSKVLLLCLEVYASQLENIYAFSYLGNALQNIGIQFSKKGCIGILLKK